MQYQTIILELLKQRPKIYDQLRSQRQLLRTLERHARELKNHHETWKVRLSQAQPESDPSQIASAALEIALQEMQDSLPCGSPPDDHEPLSLDQAMAFLRRHTPPA